MNDTDDDNLTDGEENTHTEQILLEPDARFLIRSLKIAMKFISALTLQLPDTDGDGIFRL